MVMVGYLVGYGKLMIVGANCQCQLLKATLLLPEMSFIILLTLLQ